MAAADIESWDDDVDFQGDLFTNSVSTVQTHFSSRLSLRSESAPADDDWHVMLPPNDDSSANNAIQSARLQAGIPIPSNVPPSALMSGKIQRLGNAPSRRTLPPRQDDDWADDLEISNDAPLSLKQPKPSYQEHEEEHDDFDDFTEGSLGIRFAGTRRDQRNRSFSGSQLGSAMSPSLGSVMTESEDDFGGLELPEGPIDLSKMLKKRQQQVEVPLTLQSHDEDDFESGLDIGAGNVFDPSKLTLHRNIQQRQAKSSSSTRAPTTTLTFSEKPSATRIPRPVPSSKPASRLEPVFEPGATLVTRQRPQPSTSGSNFLRNKRSMPVLRGPPQHTAKPVPFLPAGSSAQSHHQTTAKPPSRASAYHLRREGEPQRSQSPTPRPYSRLSSGYVPDTPSRSGRRADLAPAALAREAASKRTVTKPSRRRNFGDGTELDLFDDLPTSSTKESRYLKQPSARGAPKSVRNIPSRIDVTGSTKIPLPERMQTPAPVTPRSPMPMKSFQDQSNTPRYLRDTAASRIARESRLRAAGTGRPKSEGPLMPVSTNWKAQIAARSPHTSPSASRIKAKRPQLIAPSTTNVGKPIVEKGMTFNPQALRWEGNENSLAPFELGPLLPTPTPTSHDAQQTSYMTARPLPPSPPRPALITPLASDYSNQNIKVVGGMVFDPRRMCWLKLRAGDSRNNSPSVTEDEEDPFAAIEDLKEGPTSAPDGAQTTGGDEWLVGEEFDLGPEFIRRQRDEENTWRRRCESWFPVHGDCRRSDDSWRWAIRDIAGQML
ncbi:hypothetical protein M436DRAFT_37884 [Aureobasidium namibiae CBS 147.97]|uniref:Cytokinesis regulator n=1 Tax=Aureobasidium namibiae CBS 147.97 TaxID=1043004 RepID=A0A074XR81_9PEZI